MGELLPLIFHVFGFGRRLYGVCILIMKGGVQYRKRPSILTRDFECVFVLSVRILGQYL
jgi:hypothetical protein